MKNAVQGILIGAFLVLLAAFIAYLFWYFDIHLPWPPHLITPTPTP